MATPTRTARELIKERGCICECCHEREGTEAHHCLYRRDRKVKNGSLEEKYNLQLVCQDCHHKTGKADSHENKIAFWHRQVNRYGRVAMEMWHARVPYKIKEHEFK